jgi:pilus assembly protein CpaB
MSPARIIILVVALAAGLSAALLMQRSPEKPVEVTTTVAAPTVPVLVAAAAIPLGNKVAASDLRWLDWPLSSVPAGVIRKDETPAAEQEIAGQLARFPFVASEPIRREKLIRTDGTGFLSAVLPAGKRAIAISTDNRGSATAGGFILPNDRVDVVSTTRPESAGGEATAYVSEVVLKNIRVLAIGQNIQESNGEKVVTGETATLEIDPKQIEVIAEAQKTGSLSLVLRSLQDAGEVVNGADEGGLTLVRYGVTTKGVKP